LIPAVVEDVFKSIGGCSCLSVIKELVLEAKGGSGVEVDRGTRLSAVNVRLAVWTARSIRANETRCARNVDDENGVRILEEV
jgi:hypothetical protein